MATVRELKHPEQKEELSLALKRAERIVDLNRDGITPKMRGRANAYLDSRRSQLMHEGMPASDAWLEAAWDTRLQVNKQMLAEIDELREVARKSRETASELETPVAGETNAQRIGRGQGEADYLANAEDAKERIATLEESLAKPVEPEPGKYAERVRTFLEDRGITRPIPHETTLIDEVKEAFRDHEIPEEHAQMAIDAADLEDKTPQEREAFYNSILDARNDENLEALGLNSWEDSIQAAAMHDNAEARQAAEVKRLVQNAEVSRLAGAERRFIANMTPGERAYALRGAEELARHAPRPNTGDEAAHESMRQTAANLRSAMENKQAVRKEEVPPVQSVAPKRTVFESISVRVSDGWDLLKDYIRTEPQAQRIEGPTPPSEKELKAVLERQAASGRQHESKEHLLTRPGVTTDREALKIMRAGERNTWLVKLVPQPIRERLGISLEDKYWQGVERAYDKLVDKKADALLNERAKAIQKLAGVDIKEPHLLKSSQYRAAVKLIEVDQKLKDLRPLSNDDLRASLKREVAPASEAIVRAETPTVKAAEARAEIAIAPEDKAEIERMEANRQRAVASVKELRQTIPVDGYKTDGAKAMAERIWSQLQEPGRTRLTLSAKYGGDDIALARSSHAKAIEMNGAAIAAVRNAGIPIDEGKATIAFAKKSEGVSEGLEATPEMPGQKVTLS